MQSQDSLSKASLIHVATSPASNSDNYRGSPGIQGRYFSVSTDLMQYAVYQPNIGVEYRRGKFAYGLNIGIVYPDPMFYINVLANGQYLWPGMVYKGTALRAYWKYFYNKNKPSTFFCVQAECKYLWYNNTSFVDDPGGEDIDVNYTMDEKATALGIDALFGHEYAPYKIMHIDLFYGIGYHIKFREFTVVTSTNQYSGGYMPLGSYKGTVSYPAPIAGVKIGFNIFGKKAPYPVN
jgi:hypothetical protein